MNMPKFRHFQRQSIITFHAIKPDLKSLPFFTKFISLQGSSTCDSLSDSGISDGDSDGAGRRARRLTALRELARRLQAALAPNSPAHRAITKVTVSADPCIKRV